MPDIECRMFVMDVECQIYAIGYWMLETGCELRFQSKYILKKNIFRRP